MIISNWSSGNFQDIPLEPNHDRPIFCQDINNSRIVTGSADHGLRLYSHSNGNPNYLRELFTKQYGHKEWVTSCCILRDNRIVSAGMDSIICIWSASSASCVTYKGHEASITKILADDNDIIISSSFDCTLRLWNANSSKTCSIFADHKAPILNFIWKNSLLVSGDKKGENNYWDINKGICVLKSRNHDGAVASMCFYDNVNQNLICSTGQDGSLSIFDMRSNEYLLKNKIHGGNICKVKQTMSNYLLTASADGSVGIIDPVKSFNISNRLKTDNSVFSMDSFRNYVVLGLENSNIYVYDLDTTECIWGFGILREGGVTNINISESGDFMLCSGENPQALVLKF